MIQSTPYGNIGYKGIDAAKTGKIDGYDNYPEIKKQIDNATGGRAGKMPYFYAFTKNARHSTNNISTKKRKYAENNDSTMNRICNKFASVSRMSLNFGDLPQFNYQMFLDTDNYDYRPDIAELFCELDNRNTIGYIYSKYESEIKDKDNLINSNLLAEAIVKELETLAPIEECYYSICQYLFTGKNAEKPAHKNMFWKIFGDIACKNLEQNSKAYILCEECNTKYPIWAKHECVDSPYHNCVDCGTRFIFARKTQCRCEKCATIYRKNYKTQKARQYRKENVNA